MEGDEQDKKTDQPVVRKTISPASPTKEIEEKVFQIEQLFGSKTRVRLLSLFLDNPDRAFYVRELTRRIDAQLNSVRRELQNLVDIGIVLEVEGKILPSENDEKKTEKKKFYKANINFPFYDELRSIMKKSMILMNTSLVRELRELGTVDLLFLTGRFIDNDKVPSDLLLVADISVSAVQGAVRAFEQQIGKEVNYTFMPKEEFLYRKEVKDRFLLSLLSSEKVVLVNTIAGDL